MEQNTPPAETQPPQPDIVQTKICKKCTKEKELIDYPKKSENKLSDWCKECHKEYSKLHYRKNADKKIAQTAEWQKKNPEKIQNYQRKYKQSKNKFKMPNEPRDSGPNAIIANILPVSPENQE